MTFRKNCSYCFLRRKGRIFSEKLTLRDLSRVSYGNQKAGVVLWWRFAFPNSRLNRGSLKPEKKRADAGSRKPSCNRINQFARFSKKIRNFFGSKFKTGALKIFFSSFEQKMASYIFILFWEDFRDCGTRTIKFIYLLSQRKNHDLKLKWHKPKPQLRPKSCWKIICNFAYRLSCA